MGSKHAHVPKTNKEKQKKQEKHHKEVLLTVKKHTCSLKGGKGRRGADKYQYKVVDRPFDLHAFFF